MKILISGGSGLIGREISKQLLHRGHTVVYLSRKPSTNNLGIREFYWHPDKEEIDQAAFEGVESIINLAGAPINRRWTPYYKNEILRSRVDSTRLLYNTVRKNKIPIRSFISASAVGYYPDSLEKTFTEGDAPGKDFLSVVSQKWEQEAQNFEKLNIRTVRCRIGVVLSKDGGALPLMSKPVKLGLGAPLGDGQQWMSWIHIEDLAGIFVYAVENDIKGVYNAVAPRPLTNKEFTRVLADVLDRPLIIPQVPEPAIKILLGEMSATALGSQKASSQKIESSGFNFRYKSAQEALREIF